MNVTIFKLRLVRIHSDKKILIQDSCKTLQLNFFKYNLEPDSSLNSSSLEKGCLIHSPREELKIKGEEICLGEELGRKY